MSCQRYIAEQINKGQDRDAAEVVKRIAGSVKYDRLLCRGLKRTYNAFY